MLVRLGPVTSAAGFGLATITAEGTVLDAWFPEPELGAYSPSGTTRLAPDDVPEELAALASHFLQSNSLPGNQYPADFTLTGNDYVARSLGISLDTKTLSERLRRLEKEKRP